MRPKRIPDLRKLAQRQRWMVWLVLMVMVAQFLPFVTRIPELRRFGIAILIIAGVVQMAFHVLAVVGVILLLVAQGNHPVITVLTGLLMLAPCANLLTLLLVNQSVTRTLKRAGLRVRMMGVDPEEVERVVNPELCKRCGYNLTGNVTGLCPECGEPIRCRKCGCQKCGCDLKGNVSGECPEGGSPTRATVD